MRGFVTTNVKQTQGKIYGRFGSLKDLISKLSYQSDYGLKSLDDDVW